MGQLTDGLNALIRYANEVTGGTDATISDAVESLVAGYGQGGGSMPTFYDWLMPSADINWGAYIDTGVAVPEVGSYIKVVLDVDNLSKNSAKIFGSTLSAGNMSEGCIGTYTNTSFRFECPWGGLLSWGGDHTCHHIAVHWQLGDSEYFSPEFSADAQTGSTSFSANSNLPQGNFSLFGYYVNAWGRVGIDQTKCYGLSIFIDDKPVFRGIPAEDDGGAGMYDLVSGTMKYNASSAGSFTIGND